VLDFSLSHEQQAQVDVARRFAAERMLPLAVRCDREARFPAELLPEAHRLGLLNPTLPVQYGGPGLGRLVCGLVMEQLSWACSGLAASLLGNSLPTLALTLAGSDELKSRYLGQLGSEPSLGSFCVTEPEAGSDVARLRTCLTEHSDALVLNGSKAWITNATLARFFVVFATADPSRGQRGIAAVVVDRDSPGLIVGLPEDKLGQRASETASVRFEDVRVARQKLLARPGEGFKLAMQVFVRARADIGAMAAGLIARCLDECVGYTQQRVSFGAPLAQHQMVQTLLANMAMGLEATRLLYQKAAWHIDHNAPDPLLSSSAKAFGAEQAVSAASDAVQLFGARGYCRSWPVEKLLRDAKVLPIFEGTNEIQRMLIARHLTR
jgi:acyl-CoA dehydrogenase